MSKYGLVNKNPLREEMLTNALLILKSVGFMENLINKKMAELNEAEQNSLYDEFPRLEKELLALVSKIGAENKNMTDFIIKYKKIIQDEKSQILPRN